MVHVHAKTGVTEPVRHQVRQQSGSGEGSGQGTGAVTSQVKVGGGDEGQGAGMRGIVSPAWSHRQ